MGNSAVVMLGRFVFFAGVFAFTLPSTHAQSFTERFTDWPVDLKINGTVYACVDDQGLEALLTSRALRDLRSIVILEVNDNAERLIPRIREHFPSLTFLDKDAEEETPSNDSLLMWISSEEESTPSDRERIRALLAKHVSHGGSACLVGKESRWVGRSFVAAGENNKLRLEVGWNLIPDSVWAPPSTEAGYREQCRSLLEPIQKSVLLETHPHTAIQLTGRKVLVHGEGSLTCFLPPGPHHPAREQSIAEPKERNEPETFLIDWTEWRRDAIDRTLELFPPAEKEVPKVPHGTLMIVGGGGMPKGLMQRFVDAAGGTDAKLVYVPCAETDDMSRDTSTLVSWKNMGVTTCTLLHTKDRIKANKDESFFEPLKDATGIWFGGGRQWNLADSYYGTTTHRLMKQVLQRGGVIGGSSAGASIQGKYLARATPIENFRIMAPGYERGGLGFLGGVAIDQHFSQRGRHKDLRSLVQRYPQLLGIGIDEGTAIIVRESRAEVVGKGSVFFFSYADSNRDELVEQASTEGDVFDLETRMPIR
jgi:cyanophycinase